VKGDEGLSCACFEGYSGVDCSLPVSLCPSDFCANDGTCVDFNGGLVCVCASGYSGERCEVVVSSACSSSPCGIGRCIDGDENTFGCICPSGSFGPLCTLCPAVANCRAGYVRCTSSKDSVCLSCRPGFDLVDGSCSELVFSSVQGAEAVSVSIGASLSSLDEAGLNKLKEGISAALNMYCEKNPSSCNGIKLPVLAKNVLLVGGNDGGRRRSGSEVTILVIDDNGQVVDSSVVGGAITEEGSTISSIAGFSVQNPRATPVAGTTQSTQGSSSSGANSGAIAGGVVGGIVGIVAVAIAVMFWKRRQGSAPMSRKSVVYRNEHEANSVEATYGFEMQAQQSGSRGSLSVNPVFSGLEESANV
jgi:hypothetical protein